jgi:hypothetical protein
MKSAFGFTSVGIFLSPGGINNSVYNNMVYNIQSTSNSADSRVAGIQLWDQTNPKIYYNSVYLSGSGMNYFGSAALYIYIGVSNADIKNNILVNTRDESPYIASAMYDYTSGNLTSDYNDLYCAAGPNNCLVRIDTTNYLTLPHWQAAGSDSNSVTEMPNFIVPYLHIDESIATYLESRATTIVGIETDFDGDPRHATTPDTPDIGADEFDGIIIDGIEPEITLPMEFALNQNYPNPFNPSTNIEFQIPNNEYVTLKIYNLLGEEIATLVSGQLVAGSYSYNWDASELASGIYFYRLYVGSLTGESRGFVQTRKMILMR